MNERDGDSPRSQATTLHNLKSPTSTINDVGEDPYNPANPAPLASTSNAPPAGPSQFNDAPLVNLSIYFTVRKRELALITKAFEKRRNIPLRCALFGNQGVGKSQLAYSWAKSTFVATYNAYIMWVSATTVERIYQGFCRLLRLVDHPHKSHPNQGARLEAARRWLEEIDSGNWLLLFDNVFPETVEFLRQHLPRVNGRGMILFTTRTQDVAIAVTSTEGERHAVIEVPSLNVKEAVELFCRYFDARKVDPSSAKVEAIVKAIGCLPLAISHAASYMHHSQSSLDKILELYQSKRKADAIHWEHSLSDYQHQSIATTFALQLQDLDRKCPDASKFLRVIAFFDPESIPLEMILTGSNAVIETQQKRFPFRASILAFLRSFKAIIGMQQRPSRSTFKTSLLALIQSRIALQTAITVSPTLRIHDLIQHVVLENTRSIGLYEESFELAVGIACGAFGEIDDPRSPGWWLRCERLTPHIEALMLRQDTSCKAKKLLPAIHRLRLYLSSRGRLVEAEKLYEKMMADRDKLFGPNHLHTLAVMNNLAWVYKGRGRYVDAEVLFKRVLDGYKTRLERKHRRTLLTMYHLADVYYYQKRHDEAEQLLKQTFQSQQSQLGSEDNDTLRTMNVLAQVYHSQKRYDEAESMLNRVLCARQKLFGSEHRYTLSTKYTLAGVYVSRRRYGDAALLLQQVLCAWERDRGLQHPDTLAAMRSLAYVHIVQNRDAEGEKLLVRGLAGENDVYGFSHRYSQWTAKKLLSVYERLGRLDQAEMLKQRISVVVRLCFYSIL